MKMSEPLTTEQLELVHGYIRDYGTPMKYVLKCERPMFRLLRRRGEECDDIQSRAWLGVIRAAQLYDPSKGRIFNSYANLWVRSSLTNRLHEIESKRRKAPAAVVSLDEVQDQSDGMTLAWLLGRDCREQRSADLREVVAVGLCVLTPRRQNVLSWEYGLDGNGERLQREIAKQLRLTRGGVQVISTKARRELAEALERRGVTQEVLA